MLIFVFSLLFLLIPNLGFAKPFVAASAGKSAYSTEDIERDIRFEKRAFTNPKELERFLKIRVAERAIAGKAIKSGIDKMPIFLSALALFEEQIYAASFIDFFLSMPAPVTGELEFLISDRKIGALASEKACIGVITLQDEQKLFQLRMQLVTGSDFNTIANSVNTDPDLRPSSGNAVCRSLNEIEKGIATFAAAAQPGQLSNIIRTKSGFTLVKLISKVPTKEPLNDSEKTRIAREVFLKLYCSLVKRRPLENGFAKSIRRCDVCLRS